jgi:hypothetical protein
MVELPESIAERKPDNPIRPTSPVSESAGTPSAEGQAVLEMRASIAKATELDAKAVQEGWIDLYGKLSPAELKALQESLNAEIIADTQIAFETLFKTGDVVAYQQMPMYEIGSIYRINVEGDGRGPFIKATLPRNEFSGEYAKKDLSLWLGFRANKLTAESAKLTAERALIDIEGGAKKKQE